MPELMALTLLALARTGLRTSPNIKIKIDQYIDRHKARQYWIKPGVKTAGWMSKHVLWNKPTIQASIDDINNKFKSLNVEMKYQTI